MPHLLIAGYGYLGRALGEFFTARNWQVTGWSRSNLVCSQKERLCRIDMSDGVAVQRNSFAADAIVHCASTRGGGAEEYRRVYLEGARHLLASFPGTRLLFTSSTSVYSQTNGELVDEASLAEPATATGKVLRAAEGLVLVSGGIVLRLGGIYGPGRSALLDAVVAGHAPVSSRDRFVNQIHRDDIVAAIWFLIQQQEIPAPRIFNVVDDCPAPRHEILRWLSERLGTALSDSSEISSGKRGASNKRVSNAKLRALGWKPNYASYREGFERSVLPGREKARA